MKRTTRAGLAALFGALAVLAFAVAVAADGTRQYTVNPGAWTHTGIMLKQGQSAEISGRGEMWHLSDPKSKWGPGGYYLIGFQNYDLKAKVGKTIVDIGPAGGISADAPGELLLGAGRAYDPNPKDAGTIGGHFDVTVSSSAITAGTPLPGGGLDAAAAAGTMGGLATAAAGAAAAGAGSGSGGAGGAGASADGDRKREDGHRGFCAGEKDRMAAASAAAHAAQFQFGLANNVRNQLETQRENLREHGYLSAANQIAWAAGGLAGGPVEGFMASVMDSALKGFAQEGMNQFANFATDQGVDLGEVMRSAAGVQRHPDGTYSAGDGGAVGTAKDTLRDLLIKFQTETTLKLSGVDPGSPAGQLVKNTISNGAENLMSVLGHATTVAGFVSGVRGSIDAIAEIDKQIHEVRDKQFQFETQRDEAIQELDNARAALNYCISLHPEEAA
ncbi:MAG TPA: hypothetical protein VG245_00960 [Candidatus Dormibacteraeota bacterium]|jgi:hypothetical protein|nr:hypothetical protein [Candidatus Dormibacteraeota bacterium]